jgi:hypothetical protein
VEARRRHGHGCWPPTLLALEAGSRVIRPRAARLPMQSCPSAVRSVRQVLERSGHVGAETSGAWAQPPATREFEIERQLRLSALKKQIYTCTLYTQIFPAACARTQWPRCTAMRFIPCPLPPATLSSRPGCFQCHQKHCERHIYFRESLAVRKNQRQRVCRTGASSRPPGRPPPACRA